MEASEMDNWIYIGMVEEDGHRRIQEAFSDEKSAREGGQ